VHDARFEIETGECIFGPCLGEHLKKMMIEIKDKAVYLIIE